MKLDWKDTEEIAIQLYEKEPSLNPLTIRFTDLRDKVMDLEDFVGRREDCNEGRLEAIQMAWLDEYQSNV